MNTPTVVPLLTCRANIYGTPGWRHLFALCKSSQHNYNVDTLNISSMEMRRLEFMKVTCLQVHDSELASVRCPLRARWPASKGAQCSWLPDSRALARWPPSVAGLARATKTGQQKGWRVTLQPGYQNWAFHSGLPLSPFAGGLLCRAVRLSDAPWTLLCTLPRASQRTVRAARPSGRRPALGWRAGSPAPQARLQQLHESLSQDHRPSCSRIPNPQQWWNNTWVLFFKMQRFGGSFLWSNRQSASSPSQGAFPDCPLPCPYSIFFSAAPITAEGSGDGVLARFT